MTTVGYAYAYLAFTPSHILGINYYRLICLYTSVPGLLLPELKVGQMTQTIWVTWVTILEGQVGLIHKLNYLNVTRILHVFIKQSGKWENFGSDECTNISLVWDQLIISSCFEAYARGVQRFHFQVCARDWFCILPRMKKSMALFRIKNFSYRVTLLLKRNLQHVGHKLIVCGSHPDCSVGQWVKRVNRCDPFSTLIATVTVNPPYTEQ